MVSRAAADRLDGSTFDAADEVVNDAAFERPGSSRSSSAFPQIRFVSFVESGTHVLFGSQIAPYPTSETTLAKQVLQNGLSKGMLCLADRYVFGFDLWTLAQGTGSDLLWRVKDNSRLDCEQRLPDRPYLSCIYPSERDRQHKTNGVRLRVIDYRLKGVEGAEPLYRLVITLFDPQTAPATELAPLYHERREIETALDELKTHLRATSPSPAGQECPCHQLMSPKPFRSLSEQYWL